jgi:hypothetical protein
MSIPADGELLIIKRCPKVASAHDHQIRMRFSFAIALSFAGFMVASATFHRMLRCAPKQPACGVW